MNNIYHSDIYQFDTPVSSYWEDTTNEDLQIDKLKKDINSEIVVIGGGYTGCLLYTSPSPRDRTRSRMPSSA